MEKRKDYLMGYKGHSIMDCGYFYAPYVPLAQSPVMLDPDSAFPKKGILTKYGKKIIEQEELPNQVAKKIHRDITEPWEVSRID